MPQGWPRLGRASSFPLAKAETENLRRVLITGGTGFVGTHLIRYLRPTTPNIAVMASDISPAQQGAGQDYYQIDIRRVMSDAQSAKFDRPRFTTWRAFLTLTFPGPIRA
jgi:nucleoside-diphosphate-sugar epimerase